MRVRVCDDVEAIAEEWVAAIRGVVPAHFDVDRIPAAKDEVSNLLLRKLAVEDGTDPLVPPSKFDEIDILVVDYDLLHLDNTGSRTTGEGGGPASAVFLDMRRHRADEPVQGSTV